MAWIEVPTAQGYGMVNTLMITSVEPISANSTRIDLSGSLSMYAHAPYKKVLEVLTSGVDILPTLRHTPKTT